MTLKEQIESDYKAAFKGRREAEVSALRMLLAALKNAEIDFRGKGKAMGEQDEVDIVAREAKKRRDSIEAFQQGGRQDLVDKETAELAIIGKYLPARLGEDELREIVRQAIAASGAAGMKDMGKAMGLAMKEVKGRADGTEVGRIVKELLNS